MLILESKTKKDMKLTEIQKEEIRSYILHELLTPVFTDFQTLNGVVETILPLIYEDIEETADWSGLDYDEFHIGDVEIAVERVLANAIDIAYGNV